MHAEEGPDAPVGPCPLHAHEARGGGAHARTVVAVDDAAGQAELGDLRNELEGELRALPVAVDDRRDLAIAERAQAIAENAPQVTREGNVGKDNTAGDEGEAEAALAGADAKVEATYALPVQHHACLETHGVVVDFRGGD